MLWLCFAITLQSQQDGIQVHLMGYPCSKNVGTLATATVILPRKQPVVYCHFFLSLIAITAAIAFNKQHKKWLQLKIEHYSCIHLSLQHNLVQEIISLVAGKPNILLQRCKDAPKNINSILSNHYPLLSRTDNQLYRLVIEMIASLEKQKLVNKQVIPALVPLPYKELLCGTQQVCLKPRPNNIVV